MQCFAFLADLAIDGEADGAITITYRPEVASRAWWTLGWTGEDRKRPTIAASTLHLLAGRVATVESRLRTQTH